MLLGSILLVATACSFPMYRNAVFNRMLQDEMNSVLEETGKWPMVLEYTNSVGNQSGVGAIAIAEKMASESYAELGLAKKDTLFSSAHAVSASSGISCRYSRPSTTVSPFTRLPRR